MPQTPRLEACVAAAYRQARAHVVLPQPGGSHSQIRWSLHLLLLRRRHETVPEPFSFLVRRFCTPGTGGAITGATDAVPVPSSGTTTEVGPLTSSPPSRGQSSGGALWTPVYTPTDRLTSWVYFTTFVQYLYISCYLSDNKPVLSYLLLRLLPQWSPVESLQSHFIFTMSHWSSGLPNCFPPQGTLVQNPWGDLCETGIFQSNHVIFNRAVLVRQSICLYSLER
jgi:hypothetical protein